MLSRVRSQLRRSAISRLVAACAAFLVVLAIAAPAFAGEGPTKLSQPNVSPRSGTPSTKLTFTVWYRNREGSPPERVSTVINGVAHAMTSSGSEDWHDGVEFTWSTKLPAGTYAIDFTASDPRKFTDRVGAGSVTIVAPAPSPTPTPTPKPDPTPAPDPDPTPTPAPAATGGDAGATPTPAPDSGSGSGSDSGGGGTPGTGTDGTDDPAIIFPGSTGPDGTGGRPTGGDSGRTGGTGGDAGHPGWPGGTTAGAAPDPERAVDGGPTSATVTNTPTAGSTGGAGNGGAGGGSGPGWGALAAALDRLGIRQPPPLTVLPMLVGTTGAMTMGFAFAIFGKKRRDEAPPAPDEVLQANAARGHAAVPGSEVVRGVAIPAPVDPEAGMPRWRRPSVQAARKADPSRSVGISAPMTFETGIVSAVDGRERRLIRYAVVRLLDAPDELRSAEIGQLDKDDEVQLIERSGAYWLVLCPNGQQGWIHKMTLGDIVSEAPPPSLSREIDDDVLAAFLAARARA
ncbi:MAG TPA: hypothetical protein VFJ71_11935 [Candidatus Limnocylindrales bacterium]|nr:hypothetical protein [Candidatus Limnocylindrales bacterium]